MISKQFKLYPDLHWVYFDVIIHDTKKQFMEATRQDSTCLGLCKSWLKVFGKRIRGRSFISQPKIGEIHLIQKYSGIGFTTHECCHAAHHYFWIRRRAGIGPVLLNYTPERTSCCRREEDFCWIMGEIVRQFALRLNGQQVRRFNRKIRPIRDGDSVIIKGKLGK